MLTSTSDAMNFFIAYLKLEKYSQYYQIRQQVAEEYHLKQDLPIKDPERCIRHNSLDSCNTIRKSFNSDEEKSIGQRKSSDETSATDDYKSRDGESDNDDASKSVYVSWGGPSDPINPLNWTQTRRACVFAIIWINVFTANWASSADSEPGMVIAEQFHVSEEAESLSPTLYAFGIAAGALLAGPISNSLGRRPIYIFSRLWNMIWLLATALAPNFASQCLFRFLAGTGGSVLLAIHGASIADLYNPIERTLAWPTIALSSFLGTAISPIVGGWIAQEAEKGHMSWRWTEWISLILSCAAFLLTLLLYPETFAPIILEWKAQHVRALTGNPKFIAKLESGATFTQDILRALQRILHMFTQEPIVILLGAWLIIVYIVVFGFLQGFSYIFGADGGTYKWDKGLTGSAFGALSIGVLIWFCFAPLYWYFYRRQCLKRKQERKDDETSISEFVPGIDLPDPEYRLWYVLVVKSQSPGYDICTFPKEEDKMLTVV
jgi:MFS family permease